MSKKCGILTLIPTPISEEGVLEPVAFKILEEAALNQADSSVFVVEDLKPGRRRWLGFKLPRSAVERFILYNEHTASVVSKELLNELKSGKNVFLMSDGGLPAFYDPGIELVKMCHQNKIKVTATPFCNSVALALALSGMDHKKFWFEGFLPLENSERLSILKRLLTARYTSVIMDTPYRLKRLLEELQTEWNSSKKLFLALDLNHQSEELLLGTPVEMLAQITEFKREFILIISE